MINDTWREKAAASRFPQRSVSYEHLYKIILARWIYFINGSRALIDRILNCYKIFFITFTKFSRFLAARFRYLSSFPRVRFFLCHAKRRYVERKNESTLATLFIIQRMMHERAISRVRSSKLSPKLPLVRGKIISWVHTLESITSANLRANLCLTIRVQSKFFTQNFSPRVAIN